ncbi:unnamed protein product [Schistosoma mattheei]|uniref:Uncharacterized protein n=1 Tax=Schistosoma mattheei TaxID=31246 RepID=A0A3P8HWX7_9TREM|nr:unnamed protein product [Schistosoma mattheei]
MTIDLVNNVTTTDSMDSDYDQHDCLLSPEWTVACGQVYYKDKNGDVCLHGLLAVTSVRSYIRIKSYHSRVIQLWCADSGNLLFDLKRKSVTVVILLYASNQTTYYNTSNVKISIVFSLLLRSTVSFYLIAL